MAGKKKVLFVSRQEADDVARSRNEEVVPVDFNVYSTKNVKAKFFVGDRDSYLDFKEKRLASIAKKPSLKNWATKVERQVWFAQFLSANDNFTANKLSEFLCDKLPRCSTYSYSLAIKQINKWIAEGKLENFFSGKVCLYRKIA